MSIYVACLESYNSGILHGKWIEVSSDYEETMEKIHEMLKASPCENAEEWAIHDYENLPGYPVSEYEDIEDLCKYVELLESSDYPGELIAEVMNYYGFNAEEAVKYLEDHYAGEWESVEDWAEEQIRSYVNVPKELEYYIDYSGYARDQECSGYIHFFELNYREVHAVWNA